MLRATDGLQRPGDASAASRFWRRIRPSTGTATASISWIPPATPILVVRWSAYCRWSTRVLLLVDAVDGPMPQTRFRDIQRHSQQGLRSYRRDQQGRPSRRTTQTGWYGPGVRPVRQPWCDRRAARLPGYLRLCPQRASPAMSWIRWRTTWQPLFETVIVKDVHVATG